MSGWRGRARRWWPLLVLVPAALLRLHLWLGCEPLVVGRSSTYLQPAQELLRGSCSGAETFRRTPGYPVFLAAVTGLGGGMRAVTLAQHALGLASAWAVMRAALLLWGSVPAAAAAGVLLAFHPGFLFYESAVESELLGAFLLCLSMLFAARAMKSAGRGALRDAAAAGLIGGAAALTRPELAAWLAAAPALLLSGAGGRARALRFAAPFAALIVLWMCRNLLMFGSFTLSPMGAVTSLQTSGPLIDWASPAHAEFKREYAAALAANGGDHANVVNEAVMRLNMGPARMPLERALAEAAALGRETALAHPLAYLKASGRNFAGVLGSVGEDFSEPGRGGVRLAGLPWPLEVQYRALLWLAAAGLLAAAWRRLPGAALPLAAALGVLAGNALVEVGIARRGFELLPSLALLASFLYREAWELGRRAAAASAARFTRRGRID